MRKQPSVGAALLRPDTVIGDQTSTYVLAPGGNPFYVDAGTTIATTAGDGVDGGAGAVWTLSNAGVIDGHAAGVDLQSRGTITNTGSIAGTGGSGIVLGHGGYVTNRMGATIQGTSTFVAGSGGGTRAGVSVYGAAGNVFNGGTISAPIGPGVQMLAGGKVTNWAGGGIYGFGGVFIAGAAGTISNGGVILGALGGGAVLNKGGEVVNWARGTILGLIGVHVSGGAGQVSNAGAIVGTSSYGVLLARGGEVTNARHGTISGQLYGVDIAGQPGTVTNNGSIMAVATANSIGVRLSAGGNVTNAIGGKIFGALGIDLEQAGDVSNSKGANILGGVELKRGGNLFNEGTIDGFTGAAVLDAGAGTITNSGAIAAGSVVTAVSLSSGASLSNLAAGSISGGVAVAANGAGPGTNAGKIKGAVQGVVISNGSFSNLASGLISAGDGANGSRYSTVGVLLSRASFENAGTILSQYLGLNVSADSIVTNDQTGTISAGETGIQDSGTIVNNGLISIAYNGRYAISAYGAAASITNAGDIELNRGGIKMLLGGTLLNKTGGTISGKVTFSGAGVLTNAAGATISGQVDISGGTVTNAGTITGPVFANELVLETGSNLAQAFAQTVVLQGSGTADVLNGNTLEEQNAGKWTLTGHSSFGTATIINGTLQAGNATHPGADLVAQGMLINFGTIEVAGGTLEIDGGVFGAGKAIIAGGMLKLGANFTEAVAFTGAAGVLQLAKSRTYTGAISGFSLAGASLDLRDIGFTSGTTTASYVDNGAHTGGVLTVTDGTHTAHIKLVGDFSASTFTTSSDGAGGTTVVDPPKAAAVLPFIAAIAGHGASGGHWTPAAESGRSPPTLLAATHHAG